MGKVKAIILALLVILIASGAGYYAAIHYMQTKAAVQVEKDKQEAARMEKLKEQQAKEAAAREKAQQKQELLDRQLGRTEEPDQVIRGLTADMIQEQKDDGAVVYRYQDPTDDGIFLQPYLVHTPGGAAVMHVILRHRGERPMQFKGIDVQTSETDIIPVRVQGQAALASTDTGIMEWSDQPVDAQIGKAMRQIAAVSGAKLLMADMPDGSNDDRMLSALEVRRIQHILQLSDILNGKKSS